MLSPKIIRQAIVTGLTGITDAGANVFDSRMPPWQPSELPALTVYSQLAVETNLSMGNPFVRRTETVVVEASVSGTSDVDTAEALDDLEAQVKAFILTDTTWSGDLEKINSITVQRRRDIESAKRTMMAQIAIDLSYVIAYEPVVPDDLETIHLEVVEPTATPRVRATYEDLEV